MSCSGGAAVGGRLAVGSCLSPVACTVMTTNLAAPFPDELGCL